MSPEEAFAILGDETRLNILRVLWQAGALHEYDDIDDSASTMSFSELRRRVNVGDNGRFNYHLSKLVPHFVRKTGEGYRLSGGGKKLARTVVTVAGEHDAEISGEVNSNCPVCGGAIRATYEDQWLRFSCTECAGLFGDAAPRGTLLNAPFPAPGLAGRTPDQALRTELYLCMSDLAHMMQGVCPECASPVRGTLSVCADHEVTDDQPCRSCRTPFAAWGELRCDTCRFAKRLPVELCVTSLAPVIGYLYERGLNVFSPSLEGLFDLVQTQVTIAATESPLEVATTIGSGDDSLTITLDEHLSVVDISQ
ncbi:winged helix-turn-helix domain-containing protein [Haloarcula pelagica]|uniref:winged helix-turn-helix domain-containing protein n=1 Tax=Halomicroarcula sp. GCM10025709 TaxID=3252669 RepID=UPI0036D2D21D